VMHPRFDSLQVRAPWTTVAMRAGEETTAQLAAPSTATIFARDCTPEERKPATAALRGYVRDAAGTPAIAAKVAVTWNRPVQVTGQAAQVLQEHAATRTDSAGRYGLCGLPEGVTLTVRATSDDRRSPPQPVTLPENQISVLDLVVGTQAVVASVEPSKVETPVASAASERNPAMREFDKRRRRGTGAFLSRTQIERARATRLTDLLRMMPGVTVGSSDNGTLIVEIRGAKRVSIDQPRPVVVVSTDSGAPAPQPTAATSAQFSVKKCPAAFLLDGLPIDGGSGIDLEMHSDAIDGLEVYSGGQVPIEYGGRHSECGVVMIWTRAFAERRDGPSEDDGAR
jgi:hypothetical protein